MGIRANKTGQMYLNSTQQTNCLTKMNDEGNGIDVSGCGVEKLTKTGSSCSDFTVDDVNMKFGDKLRKLSYNCQFQDTVISGKSLLRERRAVEFVDPKLYGDYSTDVFQLTLELAISCIAPKQQRPSIEKVVDKLEEALAITRTEKASTPHSTPVWSSTSFQEQYRTLVENVT